jgi:hypothetical protein
VSFQIVGDKTNGYVINTDFATWTLKLPAAPPLPPAPAAPSNASAGGHPCARSKHMAFAEVPFFCGHRRSQESGVPRGIGAGVGNPNHRVPRGQQQTVLHGENARHQQGRQRDAEEGDPRQGQQILGLVFAIFAQSEVFLL